MFLDYFFYIFVVALISSSIMILFLMRKVSKLQEELDLHHGGIKIRKGKVVSPKMPKKAAQYIEKAYELEKESYKILEEFDKTESSDMLARADVLEKSVKLNLQRLEQLALAVEAGFNPYIEYKDTKVKLSKMIDLQSVEVIGIIAQIAKMRQMAPKNKPAKPNKPNLKLIKD